MTGDVSDAHECVIFLPLYILTSFEPPYYFHLALSLYPPTPPSSPHQTQLPINTTRNHLSSVHPPTLLKREPGLASSSSSSSLAVSLLEGITDGRSTKGGNGMVGLGEETWVVVVAVEVGWVGTECAAQVLVGVLIMGRSGIEDIIESKF